MSATIPDISNSLVQLLRAHVDFIVRSADAFDDGRQGEAKRFATSMRTLFHDALPLRSLLTQMEGLHGKFITTMLPRGTENQSKYGGLIRAAFLDGRSIYFAPLDSAWRGAWLTFPEWWNEIVFIDDHGKELSRRDLIVSLAEKDAGSNVDPLISGIYFQLSQHESFGWTEKTGGATSINAEQIAARQIVHEALRTLLIQYRKMPIPTSDPRLAAAMQKASECPASLPPNQVIMRNDRCPCGSTKRFKNCHGMF